MNLKKKIALGLCGVMLSGGNALAAENFSVVKNTNGPTLGYSPNSGVKILNVKGLNFKDLNRNGKLDKFEDWRLSPQKRAEDLAKKLSIEQIAGLMLYSFHQRQMSVELTDEQRKMLRDDNLRTILNADTSASAELTAQWNNALQAYAESLPFAIPANTSSDPRNDARGNGVYLTEVKDTLAQSFGNCRNFRYFHCRRLRPHVLKRI